MFGFRTQPLPTIYDWLEDEAGTLRFLSAPMYPVNALMRVRATGSAMILIHRSVFGRMAEHLASLPAKERNDFGRPYDQIRGPNNMLCPTPPAEGETIVVSPELQAAMQEVAVAFPGFVFLSPAWEASSCSDFQGGGPHLTTAGNMAAAGPAATHFALTQ